MDYQHKMKLIGMENLRIQWDQVEAFANFFVLLLLKSQRIYRPLRQEYLYRNLMEEM